MDEKSVDTLLEERIRAQLELLEATDDAEERRAVTDTLEKLYKLRIDETQGNAEHKAETRDRWLKLGVDIGGIVLPLLFYGCWMAKGFEFEKEGTFTSTTFRSLFNKFRPGR